MNTSSAFLFPIDVTGPSATVTLPAPKKKKAPRPDNDAPTLRGNGFGVHGLIGAFFEDLLAARIVGEAIRPDVTLGEKTKPDLEILGHDTFVEVKSGNDSDHMRFPVAQLDDYSQHAAENGSHALYCFFWYRGRDATGARTTVASLKGQRGRHAVARLHGHLCEHAMHALILDARIVQGIVERSALEIAPRFPGANAERVARIPATVVDSALNGDALGRAIIKDCAPQRAGWRRLVGSLPMGQYGEMFSQQDVVRRLPVVAIVRASHADTLVRNGGPLSAIFPESQLPKRRYRRSRRKVAAGDPDSDTPF